MKSLQDILGIETPIICGAMYPCSNPELVAAASEAGAIGIVQPVSLTYVHNHDFRAGLRHIRQFTKKPIGLNLIVEASSKKYLDRSRAWLDIALEEGVSFFITALGNPRWVVDQARAANSKAVIFHDVTNKKHALKALQGDVDGFICVNNRAGGHAGQLSPQQLFDDLQDLGKPLVCAGGIGAHTEIREALDIGYCGVQLGTRFIAAKECSAHDDYKQAILQARADDIVLSERITGVPVAVINTPAVQRMGLRAGFLARMLLANNRSKHLMRLIYTLQSMVKLKKAAKGGNRYKDYFQAGKSVEHIDEVLSAQQIVSRLMAANN